MRHGVFSLAPAALAATAVVIACGAQDRRSSFSSEVDAGTDAGLDGSTGDNSFTPGPTPCAGLACKIVECKPGEKTTLRGKVYDPAGAVPLYNVMVYIPGGDDPETLPPMKDTLTDPDGVACETCAGLVKNPLKSALTDATGTFVLENVPVDKDVPVVIQVGKWRRLFKLDITKSCEENAVPDKTLRLPKNGTEGDMPQIAVTTGGLDALECLLRGIGVDSSEFVEGDDPSGHIHLYKGEGGGMGQDAEPFWNDAAQLRRYDMVLLSCEGDEHKENKGGDAAGARASMYEYLNAGGKVFATHFHYIWFKESPADEFRNLAVFESGTQTASYVVNQSFPKGERFAEWLMEANASQSLGVLNFNSSQVRITMKSVNEPALAWITTTQGEPAYATVNTPISMPDGTATPPENQCGRAVITGLHITDEGGPTSIGGCSVGPGGLNAAQKAMAFLFYDLSACVTDDKTEPQPPK
jgi:hypothetical protein